MRTQVAAATLLAGMTLWLAGGATAQKTDARPARADVKFMKEAAQGGMAEVKLGRMAAEKASNAEVKQFGERMVQDHTKANGELMQLAEERNVALPKDVARKHKAAMARLSKLNGAAFDRGYMNEMVKDHEKDVAAFQKASETAADSELKQWAGEKLPALKEHLMMAKDLAAKVGGGTGAASAPH